jgi:diguanylate cyclase (GGDEF)-like protein
VEGSLDVFLRIDLDIFSIIVTVILAAGSRSRIDRSFIDYRLFMLMLGATTLELVADAITWAADGSPGAVGRAVLLASTVVYYLGQPIAPMFYVFYAIHQVTDDSRRLPSYLPLVALPAAISTLLTLATPFTGLFFYLDNTNTYHHGPLFLVFAGLSYVYMFFAFVFVITIARRRAIDSRTVIALLFFPLPPAIAGAIQIRFYGLVLLWPATVLSLLVIFINIQQRKLSIDYLTGVFNRRRLAEYAEARVREVRDDRGGQARRGRRFTGTRTFAGPRTFSGFLADVDDFKAINDRFGHATGDEALVAAARIIKSCLRTDDFLSRYAGDEFVAILPLSSEKELERVVGRLRARFVDGGHPRDERYRLSLSVGAAVFDPDIDMGVDQYIARLDSLMYIEKSAKKALKAKKPDDRTSGSDFLGSSRRPK